MKSSVTEFDDVTSIIGVPREIKLHVTTWSKRELNQTLPVDSMGKCIVYGNKSNYMKLLREIKIVFPRN